MKRSDITISVTTEDEGVTAIAWQADDAAEAGVEPGLHDARAMLLALWDGEARNALRIDLWTRDMTVEDMNDFVFQTLLTLADSYRAATGDRELMADIKIFAREFAEKAAKREAARSPRG